LASGSALPVSRHDPGKWIPLAVFLTALAVRVTFVLLHTRPLVSDELDYDQLGWTLATTGRLETDGHPTAYHMPGYPAFVAATYAIFGRSLTAVGIVQGVLDSVTAVLLSLLAPRGHPRAALGLGLTWALLPASVLFSSQMFTETVFVFGLVGLAVFLSKARTLSSPAACTVGAFLGGLILIRPVAAILIPTVPLLVPRRPARIRILLILFACLPLVLWTLRNALVMNKPVLATFLGANLLIANHPGATGRYTVESVPRVNVRGEAATDSASFRIAMRHIWTNPGDFLERGGRKLLLLLISEGELVAGHFSPKAQDASAHYFEKLRAVPAWFHLLVSLPTAIVLILGSFGLATRARDSTSTLFAALALGTVVSVLFFIGSSRYRFPLMPYFALFSTEFLADARFRLGGALPLRLLIASGFSLLVVVVWAVEFHMAHGAGP
jgi:hypothetical protein